ncbi:hypothetical protein M0812_07036 [Anaeramoeba flamelloides]|uniref:Uncharacterized protein n=1 Tax=Anaeramoeba flamelloides TaxID=1746091 RepID=A0AAV8AB23_9EUKA|nr:hypothetical protein M0812_07036 [Anaeramoeba flamelloides]
MLNSQLNNFGNGMNSFNNGSNGMMMGNNQQSSVFGTQNSMGLLGNNNSTLNFVENNEPDFEAPRISSVVPVTIGQMRKSIHSDLNKLYSIDQQLIKRVFFCWRCKTY